MDSLEHIYINNIDGIAVEVGDATPMVWQKLHCTFDTAVQIWFKSYPLGVWDVWIREKKNILYFMLIKPKIKCYPKVSNTNLFTTNGKFFKLYP